MNQAGNGWDVKILRDLFNPKDVDLIMQIPCCHGNREDKLMQTGEAKGNFTVKSAYKLSQPHLDFADTLNGFWNNLQRLKIPPKCKIVLWKACKNILPTTGKLRTHSIEMELTCGLCGKTDENIGHLFIHCSLVVNCWQLVSSYHYFQGATSFVQVCTSYRQYP